MKYFFLILGLFVPAVLAPAQNSLGEQAALPGYPVFTWDLLWTGSWEENKTLHNREDLRLGLSLHGQKDPHKKAGQPPAGQNLTSFLVRAQALDRRTLNFELDPVWGDPSKAISGVSVGFYHPETGSRLLYGVLDEWGLPARIRSPWIRSAPYTENHKSILADMRTTVSSTKEPEAYLYLSSPRLAFFEESPLPLTVRGFASAQVPAAAFEGNFAPAFSGGLETFIGKKTELLLEGFYTGAQLPARNGGSWFSDPPPLPDRDFRLGAAALMLNRPYWSLTSDWAWSETFAWGNGFYANAGLRLNPPLPGTGEAPGRWSLFLAADGMSERYVGRDGSSPGGGLRTAGKIEWKGPRSSLFRLNTTLRSGGIDQDFERGAWGIYYRFPTVPASGAESTFPLQIKRVSLSADRNASNREKIYDGVDGALGLSLNLPPLSLPPALLTASARKVKKPKPKVYPLGINFSASLNELGSSGEGGDLSSPYPFFPANTAPFEFDSAKASCELLWSPGIFQFRTRWGCTTYAKKDDKWEGSVSAAVNVTHSRLTHMRFSLKFAWPDFPEKWNCTLSWRLEK